MRFAFGLPPERLALFLTTDLGTFAFCPAPADCAFLPTAFVALVPDFRALTSFNAAEKDIWPSFHLHLPIPQTKRHHAFVYHQKRFVHAQELLSHDNVKHWTKTRMVSIDGDTTGVNGVTLLRAGEQENFSVPVEGAFIYEAGSKPITDFIGDKLE